MGSSCISHRGARPPSIHRTVTPPPWIHRRMTDPPWIHRQGARPPWIRHRGGDRPRSAVGGHHALCCRRCGPSRTPPPWVVATPWAAPHIAATGWGHPVHRHRGWEVDEHHRPERRHHGIERGRERWTLEGERGGRVRERERGGRVRKSAPSGERDRERDVR
jgi:hypothetical protein